MSYMIGVDVGGTFTDFSVFDSVTGKLVHYKHSSTPDDPSRSIVNGIEHILKEYSISAESVEYLAHGTTVATNALIEKKGGRIGLITTKGFKDLMEIGNQKRPSLYDLLKEKPQKLIPSGLTYEVDERILHTGEVKKEIDEEQVIDIVKNFKKNNVTGIAVCTLFSFINPEHEIKIRNIIEKEFPEAYITISHELVKEFREYPRMCTAVLNTYLGPVMKEYVNNFRVSVKKTGIETSPYITQSNGSIISIAETIQCPIKTAVSGPSAGVIGASCIGKMCDIDKLITFDMGGTSADISLIEDNNVKVSYDRYIEGYPTRIPMIDIITVGAGGGSIAYIDEGGALKVGPESAGATPGPACYMRGGLNPTVTDANIILGKLNNKKILGGRMDVDIELAKQAMESEVCKKADINIQDAAAGLISVVNSNMTRAIRGVSVERGYDVREFTLMAFGGAGPLHACEVSKSLGIKKVLIPPAPGTLCSLGLLMADTRFDFSSSKIMLAQDENIDELNEIFKELYINGNKMLDLEKIENQNREYETVIDCRYERQNYEIPISFNQKEISKDVLDEIVEKFHLEHEKAYGYCDRNKKIQLVSYRIGAIGVRKKPTIKPRKKSDNLSEPTPKEIRKVRFEGFKDYIDTKIIDRSFILTGVSIKGPAIIEQMDSTSIIPPNWVAYNDEYNNLIVSYEEN